MKTIVAIGGYAHENWKKHEFDTPIEIDKEIVKLSGKKKPNVLFIPTASSDSVGYINSWLKIYRNKLDCQIDILRLVVEKPSHKEIQAKIDWADVIYVGGGNTSMMMKKWRLLGVDKMLKRAYEEEKVLCGVSAGSICWFEYGVSDSLHFYNKKETKYIKVAGLGFLKGIHNPHFHSKTKDNRYRMKGMQEVVKRSKESCLAIPDGCALIFQENQYRVVGKPEVFQVWYERGEFHQSEIPRKGSTDVILQKI